MGYGSDLNGIGVSIDVEDKLQKLFKALQNGRVSKISLFGDSITEGTGASGHVSPPTNEGQVIFDDGAGTVHYEAATSAPSWANNFRSYITANYPAVQFINKGIAGKSAKWANANKQFWVGSEDVTFVMLGTNDRWDNDGTDKATALENFKTDLAAFLEYVNQRSNLMIVMTATPTLNDFADDAGTAPNASYMFGMNEVDRVITKMCADRGYAHISHYRELLNYSAFRGIGLNTLLQGRTVGSHPIDAGYLALWQTIQQKLGLIDNTIKWDGAATTKFGTVLKSFDYSTRADDPMFPTFNTTYISSPISNSNPNISQYPEAKGGNLVMYKGDNDAYVWQEYTLRDTGRIYRRYWKHNAGTPANSSWSTWIMFGTKFVVNRLATDPITVYQVESVEYSEIGNSNTTLAQFPSSLPGSLITFRGTSDIYAWQEFRPRSDTAESNSIYRRNWNTSTGTWTTWVKITAV